MSAHTPGPWNIGRDIHDNRIGIGSESGVVVYAPMGKDAMKAGVQSIEDARLIAAAPEMLEALKAHDKYMFDAGYDGPQSKVLHPNAAKNWRRVQAAIAKAEGK
jgi:hypothetical protein